MRTHASQTNQMEIPDPSLRMKLDVLLNKCSLLQTDMDKRLERQAQSFYFATLLIGAVIGGIAAVAPKDKGPELPIWLCFIFLPILTAPLSAMFFDDEIALAAADCHLSQKLDKAVIAVLEQAGCKADDIASVTLAARFETLRALQRQGKIKIGNLRRAADTRRLIFAVPFAAAFLSWVVFVWVEFEWPMVFSLFYAVVIHGAAVMDACLGLLLLFMARAGKSIWTHISNGTIGSAESLHSRHKKKLHSDAG